MSKTVDDRLGVNKKYENLSAKYYKLKRMYVVCERDLEYERKCTADRKKTSREFNRYHSELWDEVKLLRSKNNDLEDGCLFRSMIIIVLFIVLICLIGRVAELS